MVERRTGIPEVMGSNPVEALNSSGLYLQLHNREGQLFIFSTQYPRFIHVLNVYKLTHK